MRYRYIARIGLGSGPSAKDFRGCRLLPVIIGERMFRCPPSPIKIIHLWHDLRSCTLHGQTLKPNWCLFHAEKAALARRASEDNSLPYDLSIQDVRKWLSSDSSVDDREIDYYSSI